jgi:hypothetical protein
MGKQRATCLALLLFYLVYVAAKHDHYKHLDLDYVAKETRRLTYMDRSMIYEKVRANKEVVQIIRNRHDSLFENIQLKEEAETQWKDLFENDYSDDIDRALITQSVCNYLYQEDKTLCDVGIHWGHDMDTRDETLRREFLAEVEVVIKKTLEKVESERATKHDNL